MTRASIALLAVASLGLAGCTADRGGDSGSTLDEGELLQLTPAATGEVDKVTWNSTYGELATLDPVKAFNYPENTILSNLCESLFQMQPDFSVEPNLASSFEVSDDAQTYVFQIRDDVTFWDGTPMTADDVVFSLNRHLDPSEGSYLASSFADVTGIEKTGEWEVTLTLSEPNTILDEELATNLGAVVQQQQREAAGEDYGNPEAGVMCTGPFQVGEWKQGQSISLDRYDDYWNAEKRAKAKEVEIGFVVDPTAIATGLSTGEIQGSYDVPLPALGQLSTSSTGALSYGEGMQIMAIISTGNGTFGDPAVRRALTRATDRQAIADTVYEGTGTPSRSIVPQGPWNHYPDVAEQRDAELPDLSYDLDAAKQELEAATVDLSQPIKIAYPSERSFYADILNEMANGAKELGLTLEPTGVPSAQFGAFFSDPEARKGYDGFVTTNYLSSPSPLAHLDNVAYTGSQQNYAGFSDPEIDAAIDAAYAESDPAKRAELTVDAEALVMQQQPWVPINDLAVRLYLDQSVTGVPASFIYLYYPWAADLGSAE
ncbi:ABC transporter substrate-binding protein [Agromyces sp. H3Y2-19a]|jgi:peptide/nickel transport system substrate-binding protein|uniref:ABC transporter substrate-binding protein n=1 Tax=Agromyces TaxID=33877 RepID=UPI001E3FC6AC|nr:MULTISPECIES: ABC transporter substrate-binding protein [Agromyces]MCD5348188.1 ABC transporter substrate-binding protein [Agromyces sp. S2-1-8]MDF0514207.1 ABC transporter substrate-binding protein [Agromyces chromiiresistens]